MLFYAHSENPTGRWHLLKDHLVAVAQKAGFFASAFGAEDEAYLAGLLHDFGKFREEFQSYLRKERDGSVDTHHAIYGAALAFRNEWPGSAFSIAGHHAGLHDRHKLQELVDDSRYSAASRLPALIQRFEDEVGPVPAAVSFPPFCGFSQAPLTIEFYIRMLFSCLVDADFLDTEEHFNGLVRRTIKLSDVCEELLGRVERERASKPTEGGVNQIRHAVFGQCLKSAEQEQGLFSLTVPTGGGKTLSGMAFALAHARRWNLERVIMVIPYLSIIEQNAAEYRRILDPDGHGFVVEHHSAVPVPEDHETRERSRTELAAENWDAPVIVTTSVQFIESLFASSSAKCRKLHNIARSVVILDEVQTLPIRLLAPLLSVIKELKENYGLSFLFMTATQPAFRKTVSLPEGFRAGEVTEITEDTGRVFTSLQRVDYQYQDVLGWENLAQRMVAFPQVLCVVNVRRHAFELWEAVRRVVPEGQQDGLFHLSSAMCAEHRLFVLGEIQDAREGSIRHRLKLGLPCRVVSTQLVEAGVDMDFPVVFRAMGPLDSIVQAAGRCNREGRLVDSEGRPARGRVLIFTPAEHVLPRGVYRTATEHTAAFLTRIPPSELATEPGLFGDYFSQLFQLIPTDHVRDRESSIQEDRRQSRFREVSSKAKVIDDEGIPVVVPYSKGRELIECIRNRTPLAGCPRFDRHDLRSLQRYMVNVRTRDFQKLLHFRMVTALLPNLELYVLEEGCYNQNLGLLIGSHPTEDLCGV